MKIVTLDSPRADVLRRRAKPVRTVTEDIRQLIDAMIETMHEAKGVGLAAPQVGISKRVFVAEVDGKALSLVDPSIESRQGKEFGVEGCLSIPGILAEVPRANKVIVKGKNRRGRGVTIEAEGLLARVFQHEIDHLNGILIIDRVVDQSAIRAVPQEERVEVTKQSNE